MHSLTKRILAALLAGMMTLPMFACSNAGGNDENDDGKGTRPVQNVDTGDPNYTC
jgi:hypothetical protein